MKKIAALGLAGLVGASALAMTANSASAMPPPGSPPPWIHHQHGWGWGWGGPFFLGLGIGTLYGNTYPYRSHSYDWDDHVRWCESHYRTYNPATDTFYIRAGVPARCVAPFDRY